MNTTGHMGLPTDEKVASLFEKGITAPSSIPFNESHNGWIALKILSAEWKNLPQTEEELA